MVGFIEDLFPLDLGIDQVLCGENSMIIDATSPNAATYEWTDGTTESNLVVTMSGEYGVTVTDSDGCQSSDEIIITFSNTGEIELGADTILCPGENLTLVPTTSTNVTGVFWQDASTTPTYMAVSYTHLTLPTNREV